MIGQPVRHSLSPALHNAAYEAMGFDAIYAAFPVDNADVGQAVAAVRALGLLGLSVTFPYKAAVIPYLDRLTPEAERLGSVNTIYLRDSALVGHNTDGIGFISSLATDLGFDPAGKCCIVAGAGGAARAIVASLGDAGASEVIVINRTRHKAETVALLAGGVGRVGTVSDASGADLLVNATTLGMEGRDVDMSPFDKELMTGAQTVVDIVYNPPETRLLREAADKGALTANGVGMLVNQAAHQIQCWTQEAAPIDAMRKAVAR